MKANRIKFGSPDYYHRRQVEPELPIEVQVPPQPPAHAVVSRARLPSIAHQLDPPKRKSKFQRAN